MTKKSIIIALAVVATTWACNGNKTKASASADSTRVEAADTTVSDTSYCGTYRGTLPAADAAGIKTVLTIKGDSTYRLVSDYIDKKDGHFEASGIYHKQGDVIELITPSSGDKTYYKVKDSQTVIMTDSLGNEPEGDTAKLYELKK